MINEYIMNEIRELFYSFDKTNDYYEKSYIWYALYDLKGEFPDNKEISNMFDTIHSKSSVFYDKVSEENSLVQKYIDDNTEFFNQNIVLPEKFSKCSDKNLSILKKDELNYILEMFLKSISEDFYKFYLKMKNEGRIIIGKSDHTIYSSIDSSNTIVFIKGFNNTQDILALSHELTHAYYIYINNISIKESRSIKQRFKDEIMPRMMEKKIVEFLDNNDLEDDALILQNSFDLLMCICHHKRDDFELLKNLIASYVTINNDDNIDIMDLFKYIYNIDLKDLLIEINNKKDNRKVLKK